MTACPSVSMLALSSRSTHMSGKPLLTALASSDAAINPHAWLPMACFHLHLPCMPACCIHRGARLCWQPGQQAALDECKLIQPAVGSDSKSRSCCMATGPHNRGPLTPQLRGSGCTRAGAWIGRQCCMRRWLQAPPSCCASAAACAPVVTARRAAASQPATQIGGPHRQRAATSPAQRRRASEQQQEGRAAGQDWQGVLR